MTLSKTVIPAAYIFTDRIYARYEQQYASTISEWVSVQQAMHHYTHTHAIAFYLASFVSRLDVTPLRKYMFVAYTPNESRLNMAAFGDFDKLIVVIDSVAKKKRLQEFNRAASDLLFLAKRYSKYSECLNTVSHNDYLKPMLDDKFYKKEFIKHSNAQIETFNKSRKVLIEQFKSEFGRSVSFAKRTNV